MVTVVPQGKNLGSSIGQALGQGLQTGLQQTVQRGQLQNALGGLENLSKNANPFQIATQLISATAGIPGAERYVGQLFDILSRQQQNQGIWGDQGTNTGQGGTGQGTNAPTNRANPNQPSPLEQAFQQNPQVNEPPPNATTPVPEDLKVGLNPPQAPKQGGFLPRVKTPEEVNSFARNFAIRTNDPQGYQTGAAIAEGENQRALAARDMIWNTALQTGKVEPADQPAFTQIAQRYGHLDNPDEIVTSSLRDFAKYRDNRKKLDRAFIPGIGRGILEKTKGLTFGGAGIIANLVKGGESREKALERLEPTVKDLVDLGFEDEVRQKLTSEHLSPTEVSGLVNPLSKQQKEDIKNFPASNKVPAKIKQEKLADFFKDNVTPSTSLLDLRHRLWNDKGYDWREIGPAIRQAMTEGLRLTPQQSAEMTTVETDAPIQSLSDIFSGWGRFIDYFRGQK